MIDSDKNKLANIRRALSFKSKNSDVAKVFINEAIKSASFLDEAQERNIRLKLINTQKTF